ncbi:hypothetical protein BDN70DRAFT_884109 [Pholiota conissans]|uniref:Uncharacterized protein n=1 Tax=Pholiota conissans TaxID=109636 RepID=A0A9P6CVV1_9AGAR|nr:hypothetical protein BDN70DRAFT_884109 [Pholiota conissans]
MKLLVFGFVLSLGIMSTWSSVIEHPVKRDVAAIENDLAVVSSNLINYDSLVHNFVQGGGSLVQALSLHSATPGVINSLDTTTLDVQATPTLSSSDAQIIEQSVVSLEPTLIDICTTIIGATSGSSLPTGGIGALLRSDLSSIINAFNELIDALEPISQGGVVGQLATIKSQVGLSCTV